MPDSVTAQRVYVRDPDGSLAAMADSQRVLSRVYESVVRTLACQVSERHRPEWTPTGRECPHCGWSQTFEQMAARELEEAVPESRLHDNPNAYGYYERVCACDDE